MGDGALGLLALRGEVPDPDGTLADRYRLPRPRLGLRLHGIASAGLDVSDGLAQDLGHLCRAGGVGAVIAENLTGLDRLVAAQDAGCAIEVSLFPLALAGADGAPVRAVARVDDRAVLV